MPTSMHPKSISIQMIQRGKRARFGIKLYELVTFCTLRFDLIVFLCSTRKTVLRRNAINRVHTCFSIFYQKLHRIY